MRLMQACAAGERRSVRTGDRQFEWDTIERRGRESHIQELKRGNKRQERKRRKS
jgi:hypothetical protein